MALPKATGLYELGLVLTNVQSEKRGNNTTIDTTHEIGTYRDKVQDRGQQFERQLLIGTPVARSGKQGEGWVREDTSSVTYKNALCISGRHPSPGHQ